MWYGGTGVLCRQAARLLGHEVLNKLVTRTKNLFPRGECEQSQRLVLQHRDFQLTLEADEPSANAVMLQSPALPSPTAQQ